MKKLLPNQPLRKIFTEEWRNDFQSAHEKMNVEKKINRKDLTK